MEPAKPLRKRAIQVPPILPIVRKAIALRMIRRKDNVLAIPFGQFKNERNLFPFPEIDSSERLIVSNAFRAGVGLRY